MGRRLRAPNLYKWLAVRLKQIILRGGRQNAGQQRQLPAATFFGVKTMKTSIYTFANYMFLGMAGGLLYFSSSYDIVWAQCQMVWAEVYHGPVMATLVFLLIIVGFWTLTESTRPVMK